MCHLWFNTFFVVDYEDCSATSNALPSYVDATDQASASHRTVLSPSSPPASTASLSSNCADGSRSPCVTSSTTSSSSGLQQLSEHSAHQCNGKQRVLASNTSLLPCWAGGDDGRGAGETSNLCVLATPQHHVLPTRNASAGRLTNLVAPGVALAASSPNHHGHSNGGSLSCQLSGDHRAEVSTADTALGSTLTALSTDSQASSSMAGVVDANCRTSHRLVLVMKKPELDKAHKDKQHKVFSEQFHVSSAPVRAE